MEHSELLDKLALTFEQLGVRYAVVGSTASTIYGEPRFTNDIDVIVELQQEHIDLLGQAFPHPEYYLSRQAVESAVRNRSQFNIIHPSSGLKIDCIVAKGDEFDQSRLARVILVTRKEGASAIRFAAPEDVILKKMEYFRLGESEKHVRDICGILKGQGDQIDRQYIRHWAERMGLSEIWEAILVRLASG